MDCFVVNGGATLKGQVRAAGSKNASLPLLAASLLLEGESVYERVPRLADVATLLQLLESLGAESQKSDNGYTLSCPQEGPTEAPYDVVRRMRASVCVLGPLLARRGHAKVSLPGGCVLGDRPIDLHLKGLSALGADIRIVHGSVEASAPSGGLRGARVYLASTHGSSVLGTANVLMAACLARGTTVIEAAAMEPEIASLAHFLNRCGAQIEGIGSHRLVVDGVAELRGTTVSVPADRIEAGTLLLAGAATCGDVRVDACEGGQLTALLDLFERSGVPFEEGVKSEPGRPAGATAQNQDCGHWIRVLPWERPPQVLDVTTRPFPGFPTDLQAQWLAFCTVGRGLAMVSESVYPDRFMHVPELNRLGAGIRRQGNTALVVGPVALSGAPVLASDLRASAALVIAGLIASGKTTVRRVYHLDRGYDGLDRKLCQLGGSLVRQKDPEKP